MKLLYALLGVSTVVLIGSILYLVYLNKQIKPTENNQPVKQQTQNLGRIKEDEIVKNSYSFIKDAKIALTFTGKVYEISPSSITLTDVFKHKLFLKNDNNKTITGVFNYPTSSGSGIIKLDLSDLKIGDLIDVQTTISKGSGNMKIEAIFKIPNQQKNVPKN